MLASVKDWFDVPAVHDFLSILPTVHHWRFDWPDIVFDEPWILWGLVAVPMIMGLYWIKRQPALGHSRLPTRKFSLRGAVTVALLSTMVLSVGAGTAFLVGARAHPEKVELQPGDVILVRDLHFAIDRSNGNMTEFIGSAAHQSDDTKIIQPPPGTCGTQENWGYRKLDAAAYAACKVAEAFPNDRKSLATFDGNTQCCSPGLNADPRFFNQRVRFVNQQLGDNNTNFEDKNGVFSVMLDFIKQKSQSSARVLLVFTDGDGTMTDETIAKWIQRIKEEHVTLICGGPGKDTTATDPDTDAIVKLCNGAGGMIVDISTPQGIQSVIDKIRTLTPSEVKLPSRDNLRPVQEAFLFLAAMAWAMAGLSWAALGRIR